MDAIIADLVENLKEIAGCQIGIAWETMTENDGTCGFSMGFIAD